MLLDGQRFSRAGAELVRIMRDELGGFELPCDTHDIARLLRLDATEIDAEIVNADRAWLDRVIRRWNEVGTPRGFSRLVWIDHGHEVEILLGSPMRPRHTAAV